MAVTIRVSTLTAGDIEGAITCIQQAFATAAPPLHLPVQSVVEAKTPPDPYFQWVFDQQKFSIPRNRASLRTRCHWGMKHALFHVAKDPSSIDPDRVLGVGCWLTPALAAPPAPSLSWPEYVLSYFSFSAWEGYVSQQNSNWNLWLAQLVTNLRFGGRGGLNVARYYIWKNAQASAQSALWTDPAGYYFCNIITVLPEAQGKGVGKRLVEEVTKKADAEGRKCYLESSRSEPNVKIYERMGFKLAREMQCKEGKGDDGITLFCMVREPHGEGA